MSASEARIVDNTDERRYEVYEGSELAGFATYRRSGDRVVLTHTEIEPEFRHRGLAGQLVKGALDDVRRRRLTTTPLCPFVADYIRHHPEYVDLVDKAHLDLVTS
jgi:predicted GNAT family acetyltransferase